MQPAIRQPVHITGHRAIGDHKSEMVLLIDAIQDAPPEGTAFFVSPHGGYRITLRGYAKRTAVDGTVLGETFPIEVQFVEGKYRTDDPTKIELLLKDKRRGHGYYAFEDLVAMKKEAVETQIERLAQQVAASGIDPSDLQARLSRILGGQKTFQMPKDETKDESKNAKGGK